MQLHLKEFFSNKRMAVEADVAELGSCNPDALRDYGLYCKLDEECVGLFSFGGELFVYLNGAIRKVDNDTKAAFFQDGDSRQFELDLGSGKHVISYTNTMRPVSTQFWSESEEDADFGLWCSNVLNSEERRSIFKDASRGSS